MTLRDKIFSRHVELKRVPYHWDYFDCDVIIQELTTEDVEMLAKTAYDPRRRELRGSYIAMKIIASVLDPDTMKPLFSKADLKFISSLPAAATAGISEMIERVNGTITADIEDAEKNCAKTPNCSPE